MTQIGRAVDPTPARQPAPIVLRGSIITIRPFDDRSQAEALYQGTHGEKSEEQWRYMFDGPYPDLAAYQVAFQKKQASVDPLFFAILENTTERAVGQAAYLRMDPAHRVIEVGNIIFTPALQRTAGATEAMYLMARHVFEDLGYRRYEWKCNALNEPSCRAALRLGFTFEGIFRQHMIVKGRNRDTAWFSMLDLEWPQRRASFERWLSPENFDPEGGQRVSLARLHEQG